MRIGEPAFNAERTLALARRASDDHAALIAFPELGLSGYSIDDLLHQAALLDGVEAAIGRIAAESAGLGPIIVVGAPLRAEHGLFNAAVVIHRGRVLGVVPKSYLPEYREYYEKRQFRAARDAVGDRIRLLDSRGPVRGRSPVPRPRPRRRSYFTWRCARTCGCRSPRARSARWPAPPCSPTCRRATSRSARPSIAGRCAPPQSARDDGRVRVHRRRDGRVDHRPGVGRAGA